jgi:hypothetical protein
MFKIAILCLGLLASAAKADPLSPDVINPPQPMAAKSAPVLGEAENATDTTSTTSPMGSSPLSIPASSISINPKSAKSDQNRLALESNFDPNSISHVGAQGIAQFMPGTAPWRRLADLFEPLQALYESARWLRELREQFGTRRRRL